MQSRPASRKVYRVPQPQHAVLVPLGKPKQKKKRNRRNRQSGFSSTAAPAANSQKIGGSRPDFQSRGKSITVDNSELLFDITTPDTQYRVVGNVVNPANATLFPWLAPIALRYETYKFNSLEFYYTARVPTITYGSVGMMFDHDVLDPAPESLSEFARNAESVTDSIWHKCSLRVDLARHNNGNRFFYTRAGVNIPSPIDPHQYDYGKIYRCIQGYAGNPGMWRVHYNITLNNPQYSDDVAGQLSTQSSSSDRPFSDLAPVTEHVTVPFSVSDSGNALKFLQGFEGLVDVDAACAVPSEPAVSITNDGQSAVTKLRHFITNDGLHDLTTYVVKAIPGAAMIFNYALGAGLHATNVKVSRGDRNQFV